jgi:hypothetical protein
MIVRPFCLNFQDEKLWLFCQYIDSYRLDVWRNFYTTQVTLLVGWIFADNKKKW